MDYTVTFPAKVFNSLPREYRYELYERADKIGSNTGEKWIKFYIVSKEVIRVPRFIVEAYKRYEVEAESFTEAECKAAAEFNADMISEACWGGQPADIMIIEIVEEL